MAGKVRTAISKRITRDKLVIKSAEVQTAGGVQGGELIDESLMYEWLAKEQVQLLEQLE